MKFPVWLKSLFSLAWKSFQVFLKQIFTQSLDIMLIAIKDIAIQSVKEVDGLDTFTNDQKRQLAFNKIKAYAMNKGLEVKDSIINLAIELALQYIKNLK